MVTMEFYMGYVFLVLIIIILIFGFCGMSECPHKFKKIAFRQEEDEYRNMRYSVRTYRCTLCKKCKEVDTRYGDPYE